MLNKMCGIIGIVSDDNFTLKEAFRKLKRLEYRGYDSFGYYDKELLIKETGHIKIPETDKKSKIAILHTRWATTGRVTDYNAHPQQSCDKKITIVHNGIIENYEKIKNDLIEKGHKFTSETDSEVIAHYFEEKLKTKSMKEICIDLIKDIKGTFAVLLIKNDENKIYALKRDSPLVIGICKDQNILASDIYAFSDLTNKAIFFENNEFAVVSEDKYQFYNSEGNEINKKIQEFKWEQEESEKQQYDHFMIKEIMEEPKVAKRLLFSLETEQNEIFKKFIDLIKKSKKIAFVSAGTSYHASLVGAHCFNKCGIEAQTVIASEFEHFIKLDKDTLVIALSQSGETMDVIEALKYAKTHRAKVVSIVNVPYSTVQRMSELSLNILAGQEICVAATKSFTNQIILLLALAQKLSYKIHFEKIPEKIKETIDLNLENIKNLAQELKDKQDIFVLGRGMSYPVAREIALKLKEICYIHAEGMMGGELKHGTIALIEDGTPIISLIPNNNPDMISNTKEVEARGARTIIISNTDRGIKVPESCDAEFAIYSGVVGHLLSYYIGVLRKCEIDCPKHLAKSVTVK